MQSQLAQIAFAIATCFLGDASAKKNVPPYEMKKGDDITLLSAGYEYSVISFYKPSDPDSVIIDDFMEQTKFKFDQNVREGEFEKRSIGWFRVDLDELPEFSYAEGDDAIPDQLIMNNENKMSRMLHVKQTKELEANQIDDIVDSVKELTGNWMRFVECYNIQNWERQYNDEIVYFGKAEDLEKGGKMYPLALTSMAERYKFHEGRYAYYYNDEPGCREHRELDPEKEYIVFFNGENIAPFAMDVEKDKDKITLDNLLYETTNRATHGEAKWGARANSAIFDYNKNVFLYMHEEKMGKLAKMNDWKYELFREVVQIISENETTFVPIITPFYMDDWDMEVPQLATILAIEPESLPNYFVLHPVTQQVVPLPKPLDDKKNFNAEGILLWARSTVLSLEIDLWARDVTILEQKEATGDPLTEGESARLVEAREMHAGALAEQGQVEQRLKQVEQDVEKNKPAVTYTEEDDGAEVQEEL